MSEQAPASPRPSGTSSKGKIAGIVLGSLLLLCLVCGAISLIFGDESLDFAVTSPENGSVVSSSEIEVSGTGKPGEEVALDISMAADKHTISMSRVSRQCLWCSRRASTR